MIDCKMKIKFTIFPFHMLQSLITFLILQEILMSPWWILHFNHYRHDRVIIGHLVFLLYEKSSNCKRYEMMAKKFHCKVNPQCSIHHYLTDLITSRQIKRGRKLGRVPQEMIWNHDCFKLCFLLSIKAQLSVRKTQELQESWNLIIIINESIK